MKRSFIALLCVSVLALGATGHAAEPQPAAVEQLLTKDLTGIDGREAVMLTVEYPPGGASTPHRHDAHVFVYVLEGSLVMQADGREAVTLGPGGTFYESPEDVHRVSANASKTEAVKFLVFFVKEKGKPSSRPVAEGERR